MSAPGTRSQDSPPSEAVAPLRLRMIGIWKSFGSTRALENVDLDVRPGEVHALVGENGAGKSTLMKILSGALKADAGRMVLDGASYAPRGPLEARASSRRGLVSFAAARCAARRKRRWRCCTI
ncbi:MAG: ATP-binding cassette domain-containing protein, partial [Phycisphaerae bacterium]